MHKKEIIHFKCFDVKFLQFMQYAVYDIPIATTETSGFPTINIPSIFSISSVMYLHVKIFSLSLIACGIR